MQLTLRWVPGHIGIDGNGDADVQAKRAAGNNPSPPNLLPRVFWTPLPHSASKLCQVHAAKQKTEASDIWKASKQHARMEKIDPSMSSATYHKLIAQLPRRHAALLIQLRTGHAPLQAHLHRIQRADSPKCPSCGHAPKTVQHYLTQCATYHRKRNKLAQEIGGRASCLLPSLLSVPAAIKPLFRFIHATCRFTHTLGDLTTTEPDHNGPQNGSARRRERQ